MGKEMRGTFIQGNARDVLRETITPESVDVCITSPPYWTLRDYGEMDYVWGGDESCDHKFVDSDSEIDYGKTCEKCGAWCGQLGLEPTMEKYMNNIKSIIDGIKIALKPTGSLFWVINDLYGGSLLGAGSKDPAKTAPDKMKYNPVFTRSKGAPRKYIYPKSLLLLMDRIALTMIGEGWVLRNRIIWVKGNCRPESTRDRFHNNYEMIWFFTKNKKYYFNQQKGRTGSPMKSVWHINNDHSPYNHYAQFPKKIVERCISSACPDDGVVLDPFLGTGTTALVAAQMRRSFIGVDASEENIKTAKKRVGCLTNQGNLF